MATASSVPVVSVATGAGDTATATSVCYYTANVWVVWNESYVTTANASSSASVIVWSYWNDFYCNSAEPTAEEIAAAQAERERIANEERAAKKLREEAEQRAENLLLAHLDQEQKDQYQKSRCFEVLRCKDGKTRRYRLKHGWAGNVELLDESGCPVERFCIHPAKRVPYADNLLAQKLLLEADEDQFLKTANATDLRRAA